MNTNQKGTRNGDIYVYAVIKDTKVFVYAMKEAGGAIYNETSINGITYRQAMTCSTEARDRFLGLCYNDQIKRIYTTHEMITEYGILTNLIINNGRYL